MAAAGSYKCSGSLGQKRRGGSADALRFSGSAPPSPPPVCPELRTEVACCPRCLQRTAAERGSPRFCPLCRQRGSGGGRRPSGPEPGPPRRSHPERNDCDTRKEIFILPAQLSKCGDVLSEQTSKHQTSTSEDKEETKRKLFHPLKECGALRLPEDPGGGGFRALGVLSDSENEEPVSSRTRDVSAFVRKAKTSSAGRNGVQRTAQRSQSCSGSVEARGRLRLLSHTSGVEAGITHSDMAGILLSSENSRVGSVPDRRLTFRCMMTSSTPLGVPQGRQEPSISPESNDSISEELTHFKPIVCSPCTPPKRLPDGRVLEPTIVKSTPRNLTRGSLYRATNYEASPAVLQKWRQIELDRQSVMMTSKGTLTSPVSEPQGQKSPSDHQRSRACSYNMATTCSTTEGANDRARPFDRRKLVFDTMTQESDNSEKPAVKIPKPTLNNSREGLCRGSSGLDQVVGAPESCSGTIFSTINSFSPYARSFGFHSCKLISKEPHGHRREAGGSTCSQNQSNSRKGRKRNQKTKHLEDPESDLKRARTVSQEASVMGRCGSDGYLQRVQQEREDRALAIKLQTQFDLENQTVIQQRQSPEKYFLRSWMANQNRKRRSPRKSRQISKQH
ncbi:E3 ubiquitin-protein ligase RNF169 [Lampris incognitus]|uniref:E3 ubiquitin-protein ligase RNF169 n=1 Tax=Lampris incognitus TaxID=2546036 RepID=UPI0024B59B4A|nr:E3 ubiquitin-protein ligase RNF169 [Lampris incognitus]